MMDGGAYPFGIAQGLQGRTYSLTGQVEDTAFWACLSDRDLHGAYAWYEVVPAEIGRLTDSLFLRSGSLTVDPAYEVNGNPVVPLGTYVRIRVGYVGANVEYNFEYKSTMMVAEVTGTSMSRFAWEMMVPGPYNTWQPTGITDNNYLNFATEINYQNASVQIGSVYVMYMGYASSVARVLIQSFNEGNATTATSFNLSITGAFGGNYTLTGYTAAGNQALGPTANLAFNDNAAAIQAALNAAGNNLTVTGLNPFNVTMNSTGAWPVMSGNGMGLLNDQIWFFSAANGSQVGNTTIINNVTFNGNVTFNAPATATNVTVNGNMFFNASSSWCGTLTFNGNVTINNSNVTYNNVTNNGNIVYNNSTVTNNGANCTGWAIVTLSGGCGTGPAYAYTIYSQCNCGTLMNGDLLHNPAIAPNGTLNMPDGARVVARYCCDVTNGTPANYTHTGGSSVNGTLKLVTTAGSAHFRFQNATLDVNGTEFGVWTYAKDIAALMVGDFAGLHNITISPNGTLYQQNFAITADHDNLAALTLVADNYANTTTPFIDQLWNGSLDLFYALVYIDQYRFVGGIHYVDWLLYAAPPFSSFPVSGTNQSVPYALKQGQVFIATQGNTTIPGSEITIAAVPPLSIQQMVTGMILAWDNVAGHFVCVDPTGHADGEFLRLDSGANSGVNWAPLPP